MNIVITYRHGGDTRYLELIDLAFKSAKQHGYNTILVGDIVDGDDFYNPDIEDGVYLMNWILRAQLSYIESELFDCNSVFFSPDALICRPLDDIFDLSFDLALTHRKNKKWPINNGVIYMKPKNKEKIANYWKQAIALCAAYPVDAQKWYGDQQSLGDLVESNKHSELGLNLRLLPCEKYNCSPRNGAFEAGLLNRAHIIHLKGKRKNLMEQYWDFICTRA